MRVYSLTTRAERKVCLDGVFRCPNPACGFTTAFRAWGSGSASDKVTDTSSYLKLPGAVRHKVKVEAEIAAWMDAKQRFDRVTCPRCTRGPNQFIQFAGA